MPVADRFAATTFLSAASFRYQARCLVSVLRAVISCHPASVTCNGNSWTPCRVWCCFGAWLLCLIRLIASMLHSQVMVGLNAQ